VSSYYKTLFKIWEFNSFALLSIKRQKIWLYKHFVSNLIIFFAFHSVALIAFCKTARETNLYITAVFTIGLKIITLHLKRYDKITILGFKFF